VRKGEIPAINWAAEREAMDFLRKLIEQDLVLAARDVGDGGVVTTAAKMALPHGLGLTLDLSKASLASENALTRYFGEVAGAYLVSLKDDGLRAALQEAGTLSHNVLVEVGTVARTNDISWGGWLVSRERLDRANKASLV
jgi:phosphoribosylformylglycinamidine (FGAM) synthase-like enzyme